MSEATRRILGDNLKRMIEAHGGSVLPWANAHKLKQRSIDRLIKSENAATVDTLEEIAEAVGLQAWQLLVPDLDLRNPPVLSPGREERELYDRIRALMRGMGNQ